MIATCPSCGKQLKVRDELLGKKLRCPGCGGTFDVSSAGAGAGAKQPTRYDASKKPAAAAKGPAVSLNWGPIIAIAAVVLLVIGIIAFVFGPVKVKNQWEAMGQKAKDDVEEVVTKGLQAYMSAAGDWNPRKPGNTPRAMDETIFIWHMFVMSMPEKVYFKGATTEGGFFGYYYPKSGQVEADVGLCGTSVAGLGAIREGKEKIKVAGAMKGSEASVTVNGKPAAIVYPPEEKE